MVKTANEASFGRRVIESIALLGLGFLIALIWAGPAEDFWDNNGPPLSFWRICGLILLPIPGLFCFIVSMKRLGGLIFEKEVTAMDSIPPEKIKEILESLKGNEDPIRQLLYTFQHIAIREAAFDNYPELIRDLSEIQSEWPLMYIWLMARAHCKDRNLLPDDSANVHEEVKQHQKLLKEVSIHPRKRDGYTIYIITMPPPENITEAYFAAIVHKDGELHEPMKPSPSTRYFLLERSFAHPVLGEWQNGTHLNLGEGPEPNLEAFANVVFEHVLGK
jgi:hypothetical protein